LQLVRLRSGDYAELLIRGEVVIQTDDPDGWRKHIRRQARLDHLRIRTGQSTHAPGIVWAIRLQEPSSFDDDERAYATIGYQHDIEALARARNHRLQRWIISHQGRAAGRCATCGARAYVDTTADSPVADGEVLDHDCPGCWAPPDDHGQ
jgi:hypothetical protein